MSYGIRMIYPDGTEEELDEEFDSKEEANEQGNYYCSCYELGGDILYSSNGGDYPMEKVGGKCKFKVFKIK